MNFELGPLPPRRQSSSEHENDDGGRADGFTVNFPHANLATKFVDDAAKLHSDLLGLAIDERKSKNKSDLLSLQDIENNVVVDPAKEGLDAFEAGEKRRAKRQV